MQDKLDTKNTYMSYFKKDDLRIKDELEEKTRTHVPNTPITRIIVLLRYGPGRHGVELLLEVQVREQVVQTQEGAGGVQTEARGHTHYVRIITS